MDDDDDDLDMVLMINSIVRMIKKMAMVNAQRACVCFQTLASI